MTLARPSAWLRGVDGERRELSDRFQLGRLPYLDWPIESRAASKLHLVLTRALSGHFVAEDLFTTAGTLLNGAPLRRAVLANGDVLEIDGQRFVFECEPVPSAELAAWADVTAAQDVEAALAVWLDARVEQGDAFALSVRSGTVTLSDQVQEGIALTWREGLVVSASVRRSCELEVLREFVKHPIAPLVRELTLATFDPLLGVQHLAWPVLSRLSLGPSLDVEEAQRTRDALAQYPFTVAPRLETVSTTYLRDAWLQVGDERRPLARSAAMVVSGSRVFFENGWRVAVTPGTNSLRHNGRAVQAAELQPGDQLSSRGVRFDFHADVAESR